MKPLNLDSPLEAAEEWQRDIADFLAAWHGGQPDFEVQTSGSTGAPKRISISRSMMITSARRTLRYFDLRTGDTALLCLPARYIAGKMMLVRALVGGLTLYAVEPSSLPFTNWSLSGVEAVDFAAITPQQALATLQSGGTIRARRVLIGGGAVSPTLREALRHSSCEACESYGMTETVSHVAIAPLHTPQPPRPPYFGFAQQPGGLGSLTEGGVTQSFSPLWGAGGLVGGAFTPLPGVNVSLDNRGCLVITDPELLAEPLTTNDRAELSADGTFRLLGRIDNVINSGGIKIQPEEIEQAIAPFFTRPFAIVKTRDETFGETPLLVSEEAVNPQRLAEINRALPPYHRLRRVRQVPVLPLTPNGKIDRKIITNYKLRITNEIQRKPVIRN